MLTILKTQTNKENEFKAYILRSNIVKGIIQTEIYKGTLEGFKIHLTKLIAYDLTNGLNYFIKEIKNNVSEYEFIEDKDNIDFLWNVLEQLMELRQQTEIDLKRIAEIILANKGRIYKAVNVPNTIEGYDKDKLKQYEEFRLFFYLEIINTCRDFLKNELKNYL